VAVNAADVKILREKTGAGLMDCKKALGEAEGDFKKAEKLLKETGLAVAAKRSGKATNNGRISTSVTEKRAGSLELSCETDFVSMNKDFIKTGKELLDIVIAKNLTEKDSELDDKVTDIITVIKENIKLGKFSTIEIADDELVMDYIHGGGKIGVLVKVKLEKPELKTNDAVKAFVFDCALHVAAFNPMYINRASVDADYLAEQEDIFTKQAVNLGKPEKVLAGIIKGKINKHLSQICFVDQPFVKNDKLSVTQAAAELSKEVGGKVEIAEYLYMQVGQ